MAACGMPFEAKQPLIGNPYMKTVRLSTMMASFALAVGKLFDTSKHLPGLQSLRSEAISTANPQEENNKPETAMVVMITIMAVFHSP